MAVSHLLLLLARPFLESPGVYPAAMACLPALALSVVAYLLVVSATS